MREFRVNVSLETVNLDVLFEDKINLIVQDSGTGKSYLFSLLNEYCKHNGISCLLFNYSTLEFVNNLREHIKGKELILLDNADLYLDSDLLSFIEQQECMAVISIKSVAELYSEDAGFYCVEYTAGNLRTERLCYE